MKNPKLSGRYAKALFGFAKENSQVQEVFEDLTLFSNTLKGCRELQVLLRNPVIEPKQKHEVFESVFNGTLHEITYKFLELLLKQRREPSLDTICEEFFRLYNAENNIRVAKITTAKPLSTPLKEKIKNLLAEQTKAKVDIEEFVEPEILGGFIIQMDDYYLDSSVISKINKLKQEFSQNIFQVQF